MKAASKQGGNVPQLGWTFDSAVHRQQWGPSGCAAKTAVGTQWMRGQVATRDKDISRHSPVACGQLSHPLDTAGKCVVLITVHETPSCPRVVPLRPSFLNNRREMPRNLWLCSA